MAGLAAIFTGFIQPEPAWAGNLRWTYRTAMPYGRSNIGAGVLGGTMYVVGGQQPAFSTTVYAYDTATDTWAPKQAFSPGRYGMGVGVVGASMYVMCGYTSGGYTNSCRAYDSIADRWDIISNAPYSYTDIAVSAVGSTIYAAGGYSGGILYRNYMLMFLIARNAWYLKTGMPENRSQLAAATVGGTIYAIGGYNGSWLKLCRAYDPATNTWTAKAPMPTARGGNPIALVLDRKIYVCGGRNGTGNLSVVEVYDTDTDTWTTETGMQEARGWAAGGVINGKLYVVGGDGPLATIEEGSFPGPGSGETPPPPPPDEVTMYVYPHPLKCPGGNAVFRMAKAGKAKLVIVNLRGQVVKEVSRDLPASPAAKLWLDCGAVRNGVYLVTGRLEYADGTSRALKPYKLVVAAKR